MLDMVWDEFGYRYDLIIVIITLNVEECHIEHL